MDKDELLRETNRRFNELLAKEFADLIPRSPRYHYWSHTTETGKVRWPTRYSYTTERSRGYQKAETGFYAFEQRLVKEPRFKDRKDYLGTWKVVREIRFGRRKVARARARSWYVRDCRHARTGTFGPDGAKRTYCGACGTELGPA